jgi:SSS family solute:Na+ symporter
MSTIGTHLNLGASYLINDIYGRFLAPGRSERHYVAASRWATILVAVLSACATWYMQDPWRVDRSSLEVPAGAGCGRRTGIHPTVVLVADQCVDRDHGDVRSGDDLADARELGRDAGCTGAHRIDPALALAPLSSDDPHGFAWLMLLTTTLTTVLWLAVTLITKPESEATLRRFYDQVRPAALGWAS